MQLTRTGGGLGFQNGESASGESIKVFFANSGTEANEGALKMARRYGKAVWAKSGGSEDACTKDHIVCFENSFHGRSMGSLSVTSNPKYQKPFQPLIPHVDIGKLNDISALEQLITENTCGVIVEPIQGEGGINVPSEEWLRALRKRCNDVNAVLIYDEIQVCTGARGRVTTILIFLLRRSAACSGAAISGRIPSCPSTVIRT